MYNKSALMTLVRELALQLGDFTLASGKKSKYYLDCRKVTLDSAGANLIADGMLEVLGDKLPDAVGGMAIGADPITAAIITVAGRSGKKLKGFIVRKEAKQHEKHDRPDQQGLAGHELHDLVQVEQVGDVDIEIGERLLGTLETMLRVPGKVRRKHCEDHHKRSDPASALKRLTHGL
jgi:hypothetical protein